MLWLTCKEGDDRRGNGKVGAKAYARACEIQPDCIMSLTVMSEPSRAHPHLAVEPPFSDRDGCVCRADVPLIPTPKPEYTQVLLSPLLYSTSSAAFLSPL
eukprot:TRINITY_DN11900_c0_g1_i6.p2 TRINITY_DN11900_c0_g1~~TRINITY_DN11900_c0_g1_i6.p2  ORF type:complete len:100 (-),score=3.60 TRINITY_DN11900_c0_g1_i6:483-782(-)